ncbi:MAG: hypothetical protein KatS3mg056_2194 [Chloroflexus sp.]|jgi:hypothetical protein|nr:MAG: hypothetical protein KatS3mg056_2194 [Chloroflexus sp.]
MELPIDRIANIQVERIRLFVQIGGKVTAFFSPLVFFRPAEEGRSADRAGASRYGSRCVDWKLSPDITDRLHDRDDSTRHTRDR